MLRQNWGSKAPAFFLAFFQAQAIWAVMFSIPFLPVVYRRDAPNVFDLLAILVWLIAVGGETLALKSRGDDYRRYQETTSPFIPWFPKRETS